MLLNERIRKRKVDARTRACVCVRACGKYLSIFFLFFNSKSSSISRSSDENVDKGNAWKKKKLFITSQMEDSSDWRQNWRNLKKIFEFENLWTEERVIFLKRYYREMINAKKWFFFHYYFSWTYFSNLYFVWTLTGEKGTKDVFLTRRKK